MKPRMLALALAVAVNAAALAALNVAAVEGAERARLAQQEVERVVIVGERPADALAAKNCTGRQAL